MNGLWSSPSIISGAGGCALGILVHLLVFIHGEWHLQARNIFYGNLATVIALQSISWTFRIGRWYLPSVLFLAYSVGLFGSMGVYRLFFHRLRHFPGPKLLALSKLAHASNILDSRNHVLLDNLYKKYGPIVRTGPSELSVSTKNAQEILYRGKGMTNGPFYDIVVNNMESCIFSRTAEEHRSRRLAFDQGLKLRRALVKHIPDRIQALLAKLDRNDIDVVDAGDLAQRVSYDVMGRIVFGLDFNTLENEADCAPASQRQALTMLGPFCTTPWLIIFALSHRKLRTWLPKWTPLEAWWRMEDTAHKYIEQKREERANMKNAEKQRPIPPAPTSCIATAFLDEFDGNQSRRLLEGNALTAMVGASDTASQALKALLYHLAKHEEEVKKLRAELRGKRWSCAEDIRNLTYLNGFIRESMRLIPPALTFGFRQTGPEGLHLGISEGISDVYIPPHVTIVSSRYTVGRLESAYQRPLSFMPERWDDASLTPYRDASQPFAIGPRKCPGAEFAMDQVRMTLAALVTHYDVAFTADCDVPSIEASMKDQMTSQLGDFGLIFRKIRRSG